MSAEIVNVTGCKRDLKVEIPAEEVEQEIEALARKYARKAKVAGFRPGKVPLEIVKQRYVSELRSEATQEMIQRCWKSAVASHNLEPLTEPALKDLREEQGAPLQFTLSFEVLPELEIRDYKGIPVTQDPEAIGEADADKELESLRERHAQYIPVEKGEVQEGHLIALTVDAAITGEKKPIHQDDVTLIVGDPETDSVFSEKLLGAQAGEVRSFETTYPPDHRRRRFAGKTVHYSAIVKEIKEKQVPDLNDDFARDLGEESLQTLREKVRAELITVARKVAEKKTRETVIDEVVRRNPSDVPDCLVQDEVENRARRIAAGMAQQGIDARRVSVDWKKLMDEERPAAEQSVRRSIVLDCIARQEGLDVTDAELNAEFEKLASETNRSAAALRAQFEKDKRIQGFREHLRNNKALDFIFRNATISRG